MVKRSPMLGTLVRAKTKCIKLIFIGKITLVPVAFLMALSISSSLHCLVSPVAELLFLGLFSMELLQSYQMKAGTKWLFSIPALSIATE